MVAVTDLLDNPLSLLPDRPYGAILGLAPSRGARSPVLWRAAFKALGMVADFHPFDVPAERLPQVMAALRADPRFIGGALAVPHKELVLPLLDGIDADAAEIGAVNALRRDAAGGIVGANTDGQAAVRSLELVAGPVAGRRITLLGLGGAGKAVATCLSHAGAAVSVWNRDRAKAAAFVSRASRPMSLADDLEAALASSDALVNCTSVGFAADSSANEAIPLDPALLRRLPGHAVVFDIIYQPDRTRLLAEAEALGLKTLNGRRMNLEQAVIAFCLANASVCPDVDHVAGAMAAA